MVFRRRDFSVSSDSTSAGRTESSYKPLPLKQRTSSSTDRRDFTSNTWISLLQLIKFREYVIPVNHFSIWRRHNAWAFEDGKDLRSYIGNRYASNMVFMSLLLSTEFGVLFNSSTIASQVRNDLVEAHWGTVSFWAGLFMIISSLSTILSLISTFTFTAMISAIDEGNAHCILRSSIGQYATELPGRLIVCSIYTFLISFMSFFFILLPVGTFSILLLLGTVFFFVHVVSVFSAFGRIIMHTGAMGRGRIFSNDYEELLVPDSLHNNLLAKAKCNLAHNTSIIRQYRHKQRQIDRYLLEEELYDHLSGTTRKYQGLRIQNSNILDTNDFGRLRADSKVRFADEEVGLLGNDKVVVEGKIDEVPVSGRHHFRSLTPLSDISDISRLGQINNARPTNDGDLSSLAVPPKKFFVNPDGAREISDLSALNNSSVRNVSNSSLEQWLQGTPSEIDSNTGNEPTRAKKTTDGETKDDKKDIESFGLPPVVPLNTAPMSNTIASGSFHRKTKVSDKIVNRDRKDLARMEILDSDSLHSQRLNERDMSEDERFLFDYGDFGGDNVGEKNKNHVDYGTNDPLHSNDNDRINKDESDGNPSSTKSERTRLLRS
eukprot:CAMPEP_0116126266 /NCGR_PEP_ID=MMETSP0329-20121206/6245_1 /TAXON_ID=697910 /ORGANISM="Pseudo-nitzschia arenysensis, Strain B593" /LENGTH=602 /DNA_ID=CAMNT_0003620347 /DNA_START=34 /DNA_END=1842 /DNA_ORIENTATION=-